MFNLFKSKKIQLKNEVSLISSLVYNDGVKIGTEIEVLEGYVCFIYHNSRMYAQLNSGKYKINASLLPDLTSKQEKKIKKNKKIRFIAHFVNTREQEFKINVKDKSYILNIKIEDAEKFVEFITLYTYAVDNNYSIKYLQEILFDLMLKSVDKEYLNKNLSKIGIVITSTNTHSIFSTQSNVAQNVKTNVAHSESPSNPQPTEPVKPTKLQRPICPHCKSEIRFNQKYCLNCGTQLFDE